MVFRSRSSSNQVADGIVAAVLGKPKNLNPLPWTLNPAYPYQPYVPLHNLKGPVQLRSIYLRRKGVPKKLL